MNPWLLLLGGLIVGVCVGKWWSARKQVAQATAALRADFDIELQGARAMAAASGGNVVIGGRLDDLVAGYDSAGNHGADAYYDGDEYDHFGAVLRAGRGPGHANGLGRLGALGVGADDGRRVGSGGSALDERTPCVIEWPPPKVER